ncbi:LuxR C-terminal-related transcriptional regulator [Okibacterium endophyticum]
MNRAPNGSLSDTVSARGVPRLPSGLAERPHLRHRLDTDAGLVVVRGPVGVGKTVLLAQWALATSRRLLWISVDKETAAPEAFIVAVLRRLRVDGLASPDLVHTALTAIRSGDGRWRVLRDAIEGVWQPVTLVVDNAGHAEHETLQGLIDLVRAVRSLQVIAAEDRSTVLDEERLDLMLDRVTVTGADLMFTSDEVMAVLDLDRSAADELIEWTAGFPAAVHGLVRSQRIGEFRGPVLDAAVGAVEEYISASMRSNYLHPDDLTALLRASVAEELTPDLATELTGRAEIARILTEAERDGLGRWSGSGGGRIFTFVPLARRLLRRELERRLPAEVPVRTALLARWNNRNGHPVRALSLAAEIGDLGLADEVVERWWFILLREHGSEVRDILVAVPITQLKPHPLLLMMLALCFNARGIRRARALQLFSMAVSAFRAGKVDVTPVQRILLSAGESAALRVTGRLDKAVSPAEDAFRLLNGLEPDEREVLALQLPHLYAQIGISLYYGGQIDHAIEALVIGLAEADSRQLDPPFHCLSLLAGIHAMQGDIPEARRYVESVRAGDWPPDFVAGYYGTFYHAAETILAIEQADLDRAVAHVQSFGAERETSEHWPLIARLEALVDLLRGEPAHALARLDSYAESRSRIGENGVARRELNSMRALLRAAMGDPGAAESILRHDASLRAAQTVVGRARVALIMGLPRDALRMLHDDLLDGASARTRAEAAVIKVAAVLRTGAEKQAEPAFASMCALLREHELVMPLMLVTQRDLAEIREMGLRAGEDDLVRRASVRPVLVDRPQVSLTDRERVVLEALMRTASATRMAEELFVSANTVKSQLRSIYRKLGATTREEAITAAIARQLVPPVD